MFLFCVMCTVCLYMCFLAAVTPKFPLVGQLNWYNNTRGKVVDWKNTWPRLSCNVLQPPVKPVDKCLWLSQVAVWLAGALSYQFVPTFTYGHELWVITKRIRFWIKTVEKSFLKPGNALVFPRMSCRWGPGRGMSRLLCLSCRPCDPALDKWKMYGWVETTLR